MEQRILLFSHDPGGANTVIPLVRPLQVAGYDVWLYGKAFALEKYRQAGLHAMELSVDTLDTIEYFLERTQPACVITGTSANDFTERYLWQAAKSLGIPTMAILDQWMNYGIRFSAYGLENAIGYAQDKTHPYLPDAIAVMDEFAKTEMIAEGLPKRLITVTDQPYFETINEQYAGINRQTVRERLGLQPEEEVILFVSEPLEKSYGHGDYLGYTEKTIFQEILTALATIDTALEKPLCVVIKMHPREDQDSYTALVEGLSFQNIRFLIDSQLRSWEALKASDYVLGMSSMLLLEAALVGKPILSVQIGLKQANPLVLCRQGKLTAVLDQTTLQSAFQSTFLNARVEAQVSFTVPLFWGTTKPVERILQWIKENAHS